MYEDGITVTYRLMGDNSTGRWELGPAQQIHLPGWAAGDPQMATTLYLCGDRSYVDDVHLISWNLASTGPHSGLGNTCGTCGQPANEVHDHVVDGTVYHEGCIPDAEVVS
jgi:hypothetical protein